MITTIQPSDTSKDNTAYWYEHFKKFQQSNLSKTNYSKQHHLVIHQFMYWSRKFEVTLANQDKPSDNDFVAVKMQPELRVQPNNVLCTLEIGSYGRLLIHDVSALKSILMLLESRS